MRFVIDALGISRSGGGRTSVLLQLSSVFQLDRENAYTVVVDSPEAAFEGFPNVEQRILRVPNRFAAHLVAQVSVPAIARSSRADLVHHTKHLGSALNACPYILTINDMTTLRLPSTQSFIDVYYWKTIQRMVARRASLILVPSADASGDIAEYYGVNKNRIRLVPYAASPIFRPHGNQRGDEVVRKRYGIPERYVLFVGIQALKKNLPTLIRAFHIINRERNYEGGLVLVGREYPQSREKGLRGLVAELGLERDVTFTGPVPDEELPALYRGADLFAFPSLHEGFGIVLLEAMACGTPVVTSNVSSLPEVVGDAGLLVNDLRDPLSWADGLERVIFDKEFRNMLIERGLSRAGEFSWEKVGRQTVDAYCCVAQVRQQSSKI